MTNPLQPEEQKLAQLNKLLLSLANHSMSAGSLYNNPLDDGSRYAKLADKAREQVLALFASTTKAIELEAQLAIVERIRGMSKDLGKGTIYLHISKRKLATLTAELKAIKDTTK